MHNSIELNHPCFSEKAHFKIGRVHLPVAPKCNIKCNFCDRRISEYYHTSRPGLTSKIIKPKESVKIVKKLRNENPKLEVVGIAGPGESLYNIETFKTFELISNNFPELKLCVCTNGLLLPEKIKLLKEFGVKHITITINGIAPKIVEKINQYCIVDGKKIKGLKSAKILIENQLIGLKMATTQGMFVKINTVLIPKINTNHITEIAKKIKENGAHIMNIMPLIPLGIFRNIARPTCQELNVAREDCEKIIKNFRLCKQCRADAYGIPGKEDKCL